jgi:hypothetical protein
MSGRPIGIVSNEAGLLLGFGVYGSQLRAYRGLKVPCLSLGYLRTTKELKAASTLDLFIAT